jgi:hypothetical protein
MKNKPTVSEENKSLSQQFLEKYIAPKKPKSHVYCFVKEAFRENPSFIQVIFENPQDSDMIRVPNCFGELRVRVKVAEKRDLEIISSWKEKCTNKVLN